MSEWLYLETFVLQPVDRQGQSGRETSSVFGKAEGKTSQSFNKIIMLAYLCFYFILGSRRTEWGTVRGRSKLNRPTCYQVISLCHRPRVTYLPDRQTGGPSSTAGTTQCPWAGSDWSNAKSFIWQDIHDCIPLLHLFLGSGRTEWRLTGVEANSTGQCLLSGS